ncbi:MAG: winged helix-turn-helix domain-containing protein [Tahibacter sp.]
MRQSDRRRRIRLPVATMLDSVRARDTGADAFHFGDWLVVPAQNQLRRGDLSRTLEPRVMSVLCHMARHAGQVVSSEDLLRGCWAGTFYGDNPVHKTVAVLRRALGESIAAPSYIETIRKRGYRVCANVVFTDASLVEPAAGSARACPFPGLSAFSANDHALFFGRARAIAKLLQAAVVQASAAVRFVLLVGTSGSGKSSLLHAGLIPLLTQPGGSGGIRAVAVASYRAGGGDSPLSHLADALLQWSIAQRPIFLPVERESLIEVLRRDPNALERRIADALARSDATMPAGVDSRVLLIVDPLEALLSAASDGEAIFAALEAMARCPQVLLLAACRSDCFPALLASAAAAPLLAEGAHVDLWAPLRGELAQMIRRPAQSAGLSFGRDTATQVRLDDALLDDAADEPGALPLLQHALRELYERVDGHHELSFAAYLQMGRLSGALAQRAESIFDGVDDDARASLSGVLERMIHLADEFEGAAFGLAVPLRAFDEGPARRLVGALVDARLFTTELVANEPVVQVAHEALWRVWPRVSEWVAGNRQLLRAHARLRALATRWNSESRRADFLIPPGAPLQEAEHVWTTILARLEEPEQALVLASRAREHQRERRRRLSFAVVAVLALAACTAAIAAWQLKARAEQERAGAERLAGYMLGEATDRLRPLGRLDILDGIAGSALAYLESSAADPADPERIALRADGLLQIGEIRLVKGDTAAGNDAFIKSTELTKIGLMRHAENADLLRVNGKGHYWLGYEALQRRDYASTRTEWTAYLDRARHLMDVQPDNPDAWIELSYAHNNLGTLAFRQHDLPTAGTEFAESIALKRRVIDRRSDDAGALLELADSLSWSANVQDSRGDLRGARALYAESAQTIGRAGALRESDPDLEHRHVVADFQLAQVSLASGEMAIARAAIDAAQARIVKLVRLEPANLSWQRDQAYAYLQRVTFDLAELPDPESARQNDAAISILSKLVERQAGNADWARLLGLATLQRAALAARERRVGNARRDLDGAKGLLLPLIATRPDDALSRALAARTELLRAELADDAAASRMAIDAAVQLLKEVAPVSHDRRVLDPWVRALTAAGRIADAEAPLRELLAMEYRQPGFVNYYTRYLGEKRDGKQR